MFTLRTSKPSAGNKSYIASDTGGWNNCIKGKPMDKDCNVLANCVGYANGRFNEIITELTGLQKNKYNTLVCNAENFIEAAKKAGLEYGDTPKAGAIMCWLGAGALAGHVAVVERVNSNGSVYTSESSWGNPAFFNATRNNSNGRWGMGTSYSFRGFIYNPEVKDEPTPTPTQKFAIGDKVIINGNLYTSSSATKAGGSVSNKTTYITRYAAGTKHPYNTTGDLGWMDEASITKYTKTDTTYIVKKGDNLSSIAKKYNTSWQKIYNDNKSVIGSNPNLIKVGQKLIIK